MSEASHDKVTKGARRRAAMLAAATQVFLEKGFGGATLDDVIARSGGSRATLYEHFGDKEGLFAAIIGDLCARMAAPFDIAQQKNPWTVLTALGRTYMTMLMTPANLALYRMVVAESRRFPRLAAEVFAAGPETLAVRLTAYLRAELRVRTADRAARIFLEMVKGDLHTRALFGVGPRATKKDIDTCVREAVRIFCDGLAVRS